LSLGVVAVGVTVVVDLVVVIVPVAK